MFMKNGKKKTHRILVIGVGALALYGAYSMVCCVKDKAKMLTNVFKMKTKCHPKDKNESKPEEVSCEC